MWRNHVCNDGAAMFTVLERVRVGPKFAKDKTVMIV
jgi:hypothetical protein